MKKLLKSLKNFFLTDISIFNKYFLIVFILVLLSCVGYVSYAIFSYETTGINNVKVVYNPPVNLDTSGANEPELVTGMIPVYYDGTTWRKADSTNSNSSYKWYNYTDKMWANAVTVTSTNRATYQSAALGTEILMSDINTMWVWIPRFSTVIPSDYNEGNKSNPGAFNITFVNTSTAAHDAFFWDYDSDEVADEGEAKAGFWYGKFETSHSTLSSSTTANNLGCTTETCSNANGLLIKPDVVSLKYNNVSNFFFAGRSMEQSGNSFGFDKQTDTTMDIHMSKNNEWGAVAYLTHSIYGRCSSYTNCTQVTINNCSTFTTGIGGDTVSAGTSSTTCTTSANKYNGSYGILASTTGNIYGIYDMSGGSDEYVMGNYNSYSGYTSTSNSGFNGALYSGGPKTDGVAFPVSKYVNIYTIEIVYTAFNLQHALTETEKWYNDYASFVTSKYTWFVRGGSCRSSNSSGVFDYGSIYGYSYKYYSFRPTIIK